MRKKKICCWIINDPWLTFSVWLDTRMCFGIGTSLLWSAYKVLLKCFLDVLSLGLNCFFLRLLAGLNCSEDVMLGGSFANGAVKWADDDVLPIVIWRYLYFYWFDSGLDCHILSTLLSVLPGGVGSQLLWIMGIKEKLVVCVFSVC